MINKCIGLLSVLVSAGWICLAPFESEAVYKGAALKKDYTIAVAAPVAKVKGNFKSVIKRLEDEGYKVRFDHKAKAKNKGAVTESQKAEELNSLFGDDTVDAILCLQSGYGNIKTLEKLDYAVIADNPKMLIGSADITAVHNAIYKKANLVGISGSMVSELKNGSEYTWNQLLSGMKSNDALGVISLPKGTKLKTLVSGEATGSIIGGDLSAFVSIVGTSYQPEIKGAILVLDAPGETAKNIDKMLNKLYKADILKNVNAIVFGEFVNVNLEEGSIIDDVIRKYAKLSDKPCVKGFSLSDGVNSAFLPIGVQAKLEAKRFSATLSIVESHTRIISKNTLQTMSLSEIGALASEAKERLWRQAKGEGLEPKLYLHWTAGSYNRPYSNYHINILKNGKIVSLGDFAKIGRHTWKRNTGSIGLSLTCGKGAGRVTLGDQPPTVEQIESLAKVIAVLTEKLDIPIDKKHVLTHSEAANNEDGYTKAHKPYPWWNDSYGDHDTRGDLEYLGTPESPRYNPTATDGTRGGDVIRRKALAYREGNSKSKVAKKKN